MGLAISLNGLRGMWALGVAASRMGTLSTPFALPTVESSRTSWLPQVKSNGPQPFLNDVRQIGPNGEREISGVCSNCGVVLLAWLNDSDAEATPAGLRAKLERVFGRHVAEKHPNEADSVHNPGPENNGVRNQSHTHNRVAHKT